MPCGLLSFLGAFSAEREAGKRGRLGPDPARIRPIRIAHFLDLRRRKRHG